MVMGIAPVYIESMFCFPLALESTFLFRRAMQTIERCPTYVQKTFDMNHPIDLDPESNRRADPDTNASIDPELSASTSLPSTLLPSTSLRAGEQTRTLRDSERSRTASTLPRTECARHEVSSSKGRREDPSYRYKYPQFVAGERTGGKVRKKLKLPPDAPVAPEAPEPPVKHHHSRKAGKK